MNIIVSACLLGKNCKYNGNNNYNENVVKFIKNHNVIEIFPEILGGLSTPRPCAEIVNGKISTKDNIDLDCEFRKGTDIAFKIAKASSIDLAILQSRSPTCCVKQIYDGSFNGKLIDGMGIFAKKLIENGYKVIDIEDI